MITDKADEVKCGDTFYAIKGVHCDGADFIPLAIQKGAAQIVTDHKVDAPVPVQVVSDVRRAYALACAQNWPSQKLKKVAVTGTNGKTSTVYFVQQLMNLMGVKAVSLGTLGQDGFGGHVEGHMTTLPPRTLAEKLAQLEAAGVEVVAMEASSHGLDQGRLSGHHLSGGAFTNLTRDHLDYHKTMDQYFQAKQKLFTEIMGSKDIAVLNADIAEFSELKKLCLARKQQIISYGLHGETLRLLEQIPTPQGQHLVIRVAEKDYPVDIKIFGTFQAMNLLAAVGLCMSLGKSWAEIYAVLPQLIAPVGRLEYMGSLDNGASIFVDYAHTPDGLENVLKSMRPHAKGRLVCIFGCGGDRDKGKRSQMGQIAETLADVVYVTDDNPRSEDPALIRQAILQACPQKGHGELTRSLAIQHAINQLQPNDILVIAGKGHEDTQEIQGVQYPFSDRVEVQLHLMNQGLWQAHELQQALGIPVQENIRVKNITFNTQELNLGDMFVALTGGKRDGHEFVKSAVKKGASVCLVSRLIEDVPPEKQLVVSNTRLALESLARYARMRTQAQVVGITGSSGKTTTKEMLGACLALQGKTFMTKANLNNDLGVALMLANLPADCQYAVIEMGISHVGEMEHLSDLVRPDVSLITNIHPAHQEFFKTLEMTATEKAHIFDYQNKNGTSILNLDTPCAQELLNLAHQQNIRHVMGVGYHSNADIQLKNTQVLDGQMGITAQWHGEQLRYSLSFLGSHYAVDSLMVLAAVDAVGASSLQAMGTLAQIQPVAGRGQTMKLNYQGKTITLIDDTYNANPASMRAGLQALQFYPGRKIALLGDMLELGPNGPKEHLDLCDILTHNGPQKVFAVGCLMQPVFQALSSEQQGGWAATPEDLWPLLQAELKSGDVVYAKASHGMNLGQLVDRLKGM